MAKTTFETLRAEVIACGNAIVQSDAQAQGTQEKLVGLYAKLVDFYASKRDPLDSASMAMVSALEETDLADSKSYTRVIKSIHRADVTYPMAKTLSIAHRKKLAKCVDSKSCEPKADDDGNVYVDHAMLSEFLSTNPTAEELGEFINEAMGKEKKSDIDRAMDAVKKLETSDKVKLLESLMATDTTVFNVLKEKLTGRAAAAA